MTQTARVYGGSLYDLAAEEKKTEEIREQMAGIRQILNENPDYVRLLSEPSIPAKDRTALIEEAFGACTERYLTNFMKILCERGLLREFGGCCEEFNRKFNADHNIEEAVVTSAVPLSDSQKDALLKKLSAMCGRQVVMTCRTDPRVLGGIRVEMAGKQFDGTVQGRLAGISKAIK